MSKIQWIKLSVDLFDNKKIKYLRRLPHGNDLALIWVMLLTLAGQCNADGKIFITKSLPCSPEALAEELGFEAETVKQALKCFKELDMIKIAKNGHILISGWAEHQSMESTEKVREQNRLRKQKQREKEKQLAESVTSRDSHATETEEETEKETEKETETEKNENERADKPPRTHFVKPTYDEVKQYCDERMNLIDPQYFIDFYDANGWTQGKDKPIKDWRAVVRTWENRDKNTRPPNIRFDNSYYDYDGDESL